MGDFKIMYQVSLPEYQDADVFEAFMNDRYFPAVHKGPTRVGQVTSLALWRGVSDTAEPSRTFVVLMGFAGMDDGQLRVDDDEVRAAYDAFGAPLQRIGAFVESGAWVPIPDEGVASDQGR